MPAKRRGFDPLSVHLPSAEVTGIGNGPAWRAGGESSSCRFKSCPRRSHSGPVVELVTHLLGMEETPGSIPGWSIKGPWCNGITSALQAGDWEFESPRVHHHHACSSRARTPVLQAGYPRSTRGRRMLPWGTWKSSRTFDPWDVGSNPAGSTQKHFKSGGPIE